MTRWYWIFAAVAILGVTLSVSTADDALFGKDPGFRKPAAKTTKVEYFSRNGKEAVQVGKEVPEPEPAKLAPAPQVKNYYNELFGGQDEPQQQKEVIHAEFDAAPSPSAAPAIRQVGSTTVEELAPFRRSAEAETEKPAEPIEPAATPNEFEAAFSEPPAVPTTDDVVHHEPIQRDNPLVTADSEGPKTPMLNIRWAKRSEINVGQPSDCDLVIKNTGSVLAHDVEVDAFFPTSVRLTSADPEPVETTDRLVWKISQLAPGAEKTIHINFIPSRRGPLDMNANVRFTGAAAGSFVVTEPLLNLTLQGPKEVVVGEPASQLIRVSNPGTGITRNVTIEAKIPTGLEHARGERLLMEIGSLNPGESRTVRLALLAVGGGHQQLSVNATADDSLKQHAAADVFVIAPDLKLVADGPGLRYVGRTATYKLHVTNTGAAVSSNVRVMHRVPDGFEVVEASDSGKFDPASRVIKWFIGRLEPGDSVDMKVVLTANEIGDFVHQLGAISEHGARSEAQVATTVEGNASLVLEIIDLDDPVEVGSQTAYEIRVHNDGSKSAEKVGVSCELPTGLQLVEAEGPTEFLNENGLIVFKSVPELEPGNTAIYKVQVMGREEGNHRFRVRLASDSITEPLIFEELTKFYEE